MLKHSKNYLKDLKQRLRFLNFQESLKKSDLKLNILEWCGKRFFEFRVGNKMYIGFSIALLNFVLIFQRFFIDMTDSVHEVISNIVIFAILFFIIYLPIALVVGKWHYKNQYRVDNSLEFFKDSGLLKCYKLLFDLKTNSANPKEIESFKKLLNVYEEKSKVTFLK